MQPRFSIVTPSYRASEWLKLCIASVADQGVPLEHIVQDSCSDDGTQEWLPGDTRVEAIIERDEGMYDAVNRGFRRSQGEILAYLNCDEQYLPGALTSVDKAFQQDPKVDVLFAHALVVDHEGNYICERKVLTPQRYHTLVGGNLSFLTCAMFIRRRVFDRNDMWFDPDLRAAGDNEWALRLVTKNFAVRVLDVFTSIFTDTGENLGLSNRSVQEGQQIASGAPSLIRRIRPAIILHYRLRRLLRGYYRSLPLSYSIYTKDGPKQRREFRAANPTFRWHRNAQLQPPEPLLPKHHPK